MKDGYYWVRGEGSCYDWEIAKCKDNWFYADSGTFMASEIEIGDYIETPDKYKE